MHVVDDRNFTLVKPSALILPKSFELCRVPPRRPEEMQSDYLEKFDFKTIYYDVFESGDGSEIIGVGPPLRNLRKFIEESTVETDGAPTKVESSNLDRVHISKMPNRCEAPATLSMSHRLGSISCTVERNLEHVFSGRKVLMTKSKNNSLSWIADWAQFYVSNHGIDALLLYDNGSTDYLASDILGCLRDISGLEVCVVVEWNYPWGAPGGVWAGNKEIPWDSDYCQYGVMEHARYRFLGKARIVINHDIDELLVIEGGRTVVEVMEDVGGAGIIYGGRWIESIGHDGAREPRFLDYFYYDKNRGLTTKKWVISPALAEGAKQWKLHSVPGLSLSKVGGVAHRHFMGISNNWKHNRTAAKTYDSKRHVFDNDLARALNVAFSANIEEREVSADLETERSPMSALPVADKLVPHMPDAAVSALSRHLKGAQCYLEYGCGGSTALAAELNVPNIISVDTSLEWLNKVGSDIKSVGYEGCFTALYVDIGPTKKWGYPTDESRFRSWSKYYITPWAHAREVGLDPDLILIDGRFRVSCFLVSLAHASKGTTFLFDDYLNRKHYHAIAKLLEPLSHYDRMAEFVKVTEVRAEDILQLAGEFFFDTR